MVNGLVVDRIARFLYWTDEDLQYIQSSKYDGSNMRIVVYRDLQMPRGLAVDHLQGYVWTDKLNIKSLFLKSHER